MAEQVIAKLAREFVHHCDVTAVLSEHEPLLASHHFLDAENLPPPSATDICVVILWSRLGFLLQPEKFRGAISAREVTGTEWEFEDALDSLRETGRPELLLYQKTADIMASLADDAALEEMREQKRAVADFISRWFKSADGTAYASASHTFATTAVFEEQLGKHLRALLLRRLASDTGLETDANAITWTGPPWPALAAFDMAQAPVFFGRSRARNELRELLAAQAKAALATAGATFVLVIGASGSGKSSLVRAGLLPDLILPGMVGDVGLVRYGIMRPSDAADDILRALAEGIMSATALPELAGLEYRAEILAEQLRENPTQAAFGIRQGLAQAAAGKLTARGQARLVIVADQLEELFTLERISRQDAEAFVAALYTLARSGLVWVIGTLRADFFVKLEQLPALARASDGGRYLLLPPTLAELTDIVTRPARAGGLRFEISEAAGSGLDSAIVAAAAHDPGALPLLSFALDALWRQPREGAELTFAAYEALGGLEGAIANHAEALVSALPEAAQAVLPGLLLGLVTIRDGEQQATARACRRSDLARSGPADLIIERLIEGRLLIADDASAASTVRLAHEALLRSWPRLDGLIEASRELLAAMTRLRADQSEWERHGRPADLLLPPGKRLSEGLELLDGRPDDMGEALVGFIRASADAAFAARSRRRRVVAGAFAALGVLTVAAGSGAWFGFSGRFAAEASRNAYQRQLEIAESRRSQILALALKSEADPGVVEAVALSALPRHAASGTSPGSALLDRLVLAANAKAQRMVLSGYGNQAVCAVFSPDGTRIVTASFDRKARIWSASTGALLMTLSGHTEALESAAYSADGRRIVTAADDRTARIWDADTGAMLLTLSGHTGNVDSAYFSPDGRRIVTSSEDRTARVYDASTGALLTMLTGHGDAVSFANFSPDGRRIITASLDKTARIWDAATGMPLMTLAGHDGFVMTAAFSPDGTRIVTTSADKTARVWDAATGTVLMTIRGQGSGLVFAVFSPDGRRIATGSSDKTARIWNAGSGALLETLVGHANAVVSVAFSPDGRRLVTASIDNTARVWDAVSSTPRFALTGHKDHLLTASYSPNGRRIVTASSDRTARIWNADSGAFIASLIGHDGGVVDAAFSPDGNRVVTSSLDRTMRIWDASDGTLLKTFPGNSTVIFGADFSPDGRLIAAASVDKVARVVDAETGAVITTFKGHTGWVRHARFSPDGHRILTASVDGTARLWDASSGAALLTLSGHGAEVTDARFSTDGSRIVTASADKTARIWDAASGALLHILSGHEAIVRSAAFIPDGSRVVTASTDGSARVWDASSGAPLMVLTAGGASVRDAVFSPDGRAIVTAFDDKVARIWDAPDYLDLSDLAFIRATSSRDLDSALRAQYALGAASSPVPVTAVAACHDASSVAKTADASQSTLAAWIAGAKSGDGTCHQRLAERYEAGAAPDLARAFFHHALAGRLLEDQGAKAAAQDERYRREALAWTLPRRQVEFLMDAADDWVPGQAFPDSASLAEAGRPGTASVPPGRRLAGDPPGR